jgi:hypothetical protein
MAQVSPSYIDATNLKALAFLALVGAGATSWWAAYLWWPGAWRWPPP